MHAFSTILALLILVARPDFMDEVDSTKARLVLEDFESDTPGEAPARWRFLARKDREFKRTDAFMNENERFYVVSEGGNKFVRAYTKGEAQRVSLPAGKLQWELSEYPILSWNWRALQLPAGAGEDKVNDTGGAVYVSFSKTDWLGRPLSIKYTYSSSLTPGTEVSTGNVKVIVVSSGTNGIGEWEEVERNVVADYRRLFGGDPPNEPYTVTLWSDSDDTKSVGEVDFDDLTLKRAR